MAKVSLYPRVKKARKPTPINLYLITDEKKRFRFSTGISVHPKDWDFKAEEIKDERDNRELKRHAEKLEGLKKRVKEYYEDALEQGTFDIKGFIQDRLNGNDDESDVSGFWTTYDAFMEVGKAEKTDGTLKVYRVMKYRLTRFTESTGYPISFESMTMEFRDKFIKFLVEELRLQDSTIKKTIVALKALLNYATKHGHNTNLEYKKFQFTVKPAEKVALSQNELKAIIDLDLSQKPRLDRIRDAFVFGSETGLRFSDMMNLKPVNVRETEIDGQQIRYINLVAIKTRAAINAPLSDIAAKIIDKYQDENRTTCFQIISSQKFNKYIKEVAQLAGIDTIINRVRYIGNKRVEDQILKYQLLSSHSMRRSFVTIAVEKGYTIPQVMIFTGHKNYKELELYWKKSPESNLRVALGMMKGGVGR